MATPPAQLNRTALLRNLIHAQLKGAPGNAVLLDPADVEEDQVQELFILRDPGSPGNPSATEYQLEGIFPGSGITIV